MNNNQVCLFVAGVVFILSACATSSTNKSSTNRLKQGTHEYTILVNGFARNYVLHIPSTAKKGVAKQNNKSAVVIMLHGAGGTAKSATKMTGWTGLADKQNFIVAYPQGVRPNPEKRASFRYNPQTWNDGSGRFYSGQEKIDDVSFINSLLDKLIRDLSVDEQRIYVAGFSNGSSMAYRLSVDLSHRIAAIAAIASSGMRVSNVRLDWPVSLIAIQGSEDPINPIAGGEVTIAGQSDKRRPLIDTIQAWARMLECPTQPIATSPLQDVSIQKYWPCSTGSEVRFYTIDNMGHTWPGGRNVMPRALVGKSSERINATNVVWKFFKQHNKRFINVQPLQ